MRVPHIAVRRPVTILMGVLILILLGLVSLTRLPIDLFPNIEVPVLAIITNYEDAGPYEVENLVSRPLEEALGAVNGVKKISSYSNKGSSVVVVEFDWGTDMDFAALDVREKVDLVKDFLPEEADSPIVFSYDPNSMPIMQLVLMGDKPAHELRYIAEDTLKNRLERIDGVAAVDITGGEEREIRVIVHPGLLQNYGISLDTVVKSLQLANFNLPAGRVTEKGKDYVLRTTAEFRSVKEIAEVRIPTASGSLIKLADIARIEDGFKEVDQLSRFNGEPAIVLSIRKEANANTVQVAARVGKAIASLQPLLGGAKLAVAEDLSTFVKQSILTVTQNALRGGILAVLVLFLFLRSIRTTLIIAVAIPISVVSTFTMIYFSHTTLNMISMGGLALGIGMLVDNAIVVLESIFRHWEKGKPREAAAAEGAEEVGTAITASTLTTVSVFLPVVFISGIAAEIFSDMALTVTFSLLASLAVALTVIPSLAAKLFSRRNNGSNGEKRKGLVQAMFENLQDRYSKGIVWALRHSVIVLAIAIGAFAFALFLAPRVGMEFMPQMDEGLVSINVEMPRGTKLADTNDLMSKVEQYVVTIPEVKSVYVSIGGGGTQGTGSAESGRLGIQLVSLDERKRSTTEVIAQLREYVAQIPGADISVTAQSNYTGTFGDPIQVMIKGDDLDELARVADCLKPIIAAVPGTREVRTNLEETRPEYQIRINRDKAARYGLPIAQIASTVRTAVNGQVATRYRTEGKEIDVVVRLSEEWRNTRADISNIPLTTASGTQVSLGEVAELERGASPVEVRREGQVRVVSIRGQIANRDLASVIRDIKSEIDKVDLPEGVFVEFGGQNEEMNEAFGQLAQSLVLGSILVFMIMASQFESLLQPFAIMFTLPLAFVGVVLGLLIGGSTLNVVAFVGAIMLAGIVVNNGIVLIDYVNTLRREGMSRDEALAEAGRVRLRPILMTTLTTVLGLIPLALGMGEGSEMQRPIAFVVIGGLSTSTLLTLFVIPVAYSLLDGLKIRVRRQNSFQGSGPDHAK